MSRATFRVPAGLPGRFNDLVRLYPPDALHDDVDHANTVEMFDALLRLPRRTQGQERYLETLSLLVGAYDDHRYASTLSPWSPLEALRYLCAENGMNAAALGDLLGSRSLGSKLLGGERRPGKKHIRILGRHFRVRTDLLLGRGGRLPQRTAVRAGPGDRFEAALDKAGRRFARGRGGERGGPRGGPARGSRRGHPLDARRRDFHNPLA